MELSLDSYPTLSEVSNALIELLLSQPNHEMRISEVYEALADRFSLTQEQRDAPRWRLRGVSGKRGDDENFWQNLVRTANKALKVRGVIWQNPSSGHFRGLCRLLDVAGKTPKKRPVDKPKKVVSLESSDHVASAFELLLEEIDKQIENLNRAGAEAILRAEYRCANALIEKASAGTSFRDTVAGLQQEWTGFTSGQTVPSPERNQRESLQAGKTRKRLRHGLRTGESDFYLSILHTLVKMGGAGRAQAVVDTVGKLMQPRLTNHDLRRLSRGEVRWRKSVHFARDRMVKEGLLTSNSPRGIWEITALGRQWLAENADETLPGSLQLDSRETVEPEGQPELDSMTDVLLPRLPASIQEIADMGRQWLSTTTIQAPSAELPMDEQKKPKETSVKGDANDRNVQEQSITIRMNYGGSKATAQYVGGSVTLQKGTPVKEKISPSLPPHLQEQRARLRRDGKLISSGRSGYLMLTEPVTFNSPTAAAKFIAGCSVSGNREWMVLSTGQRLGEWLRNK